MRHTEGSNPPHAASPRCPAIHIVLLDALLVPTRTAAWSSRIVFLLLSKAVGWDGW